jgi:putative phage-type endonuclease
LVARSTSNGKSNGARRSAYEEIAADNDRADWLAARQTGLGASEAATVMGVNPFESPYTLYMKKTGQLPEEPDNQKMAWGKRLEPLLATTFAEDTGRQVFKGVGGTLLRSRAYPWLLATPDFEQRRKPRARAGLLEIKTTAEHNEEYWRTDTPVYYQCQLQQQLIVAARRYGSICCLIGGQDFRFAHYDQHERFAQALLRKTHEFWQMIQKGEAPEPDASVSTYDTLTRLKESGQAMDLAPVVVEWFEQMRDAAARKSAAEKEYKEAKRLIGSAMGLASYGIFPDRPGVLKFVTVTKDGYTVKPQSYRDLRYSKKVPKEAVA